MYSFDSRVRYSEIGEDKRLTMTGLLNYPVLADAGYLALNAETDADTQKAARSAALWLYSSGDGEMALTETLGVITPWNTASDVTPLGAMQVEQAGTGILPGLALTASQADALAENELAVGEDRTRAEFIDAALQALGVTEAEQE